MHELANNYPRLIRNVLVAKDSNESHPCAWSKWDKKPYIDMNIYTSMHACIKLFDRENENWDIHTIHRSVPLSLKNFNILSLFGIKRLTFTFSSPLTVDRSCLSAEYKSKNGRPPYSVRYTGTPAAHERRREDDYDGITVHFSFSFWFFRLQPGPGRAAATASTPPSTSVHY